MAWHIPNLLRRPPATKVAFIHIPKCAGSSINWHFKKHLGSARSGRTQMVNAIVNKQTGQTVDTSALRQAPFVAGHCGWDDVALLADTHLRFTVLRDPVARTLSLYDFLRDLPAESHAPYFPVAAAKQMSFAEFCTSDDPAIRVFVDNVQARTLASCYTKLDQELCETWRDKAEAHLRALDFVALSETLDEDLQDLCARAGIPAPKRSIRKNVRRASKADLPTPEEAAELLGPRIAVDQKLYDMARVRRERSRSPSASESAS